MSKKLGQLCEFLYGDSLPEAKRASDGNVPVYGSNGIVGFHDKSITGEVTIIIGRKGSIGEVHWSDIPCWPIDTTYYIQQKDVKCDLRWLFYTLKALDLSKLNKAAAVPGLNREDAYLEDIPFYPSLDDQKRIAGILDRADRLRRLRRHARQQTDTFLQSVFIEMFGDPTTNPKGWKQITLDDVIESAKDGPHVSPEYSESGIPFLSTRNVRKGQLVWDDLKYISEEEAKIHWSKCRPEKGDILYTKGGTTGFATLVDFDIPVAVWVHIAVLKPISDKVNSTWLEAMLNTDYCYQQSQKLTYGAVNRDLGLTRMIKIKMYLPSMEHQKKFEQLARHYNKICNIQQEAERQAGVNFQALLHRAFSGKLSLEEVAI